VAFVPTAADRNGNFSATAKQLVDPVTGATFPGNQIPASLLDPVAKFILSSIPLPNGPGRQLTFLGTASVSNDDQFMPKVDSACSLEGTTPTTAVRKRARPLV
jgi:hypothetical protein